MWSVLVLGLSRTSLQISSNLTRWSQIQIDYSDSYWALAGDRPEGPGVKITHSLFTNALRSPPTWPDDTIFSRIISNDETWHTPHTFHGNGASMHICHSHEVGCMHAAAGVNASWVTAMKRELRYDVSESWKMIRDPKKSWAYCTRYIRCPQNGRHWQ